MTEIDANRRSDLSVSQELIEGFRQAMRRLVATVTIVAAGDEGGRAGMVATAVMSVAANPPSLAIGVNREAGVWQAIQRSGHFSVNLLSNTHTSLVLPFSGQLQGEERFTLGEWETHHTCVPYLADAVVTLFCKSETSVDYGTHTVFIGAVEDIRFSPNANEPLLWRNGSFANAVSLEDLIG